MPICRVCRVFRTVETSRAGLLSDIAWLEGPALEPAQDFKGDHQADNNAPDDRRGNQPQIGGLDDLPGLIRPAQLECETAKQSEAGLAVLTAAQISPQDRI